jgi:hypothetical protein
MSWFAYIHVPSGTVLSMREHDVPPTPAPHKIELQEGEVVDKGWTYSANSTPRFIAPPQVITWTAYQFLLRFTEAELTGIKQDAVTDPVTWRFLTLATAAQEIINNDPTTVSGMDYLVSKNLITAQRKQEILG